MLVLLSTTDKIQITTSAAVTVDVHASGVDWTIATELSAAFNQNTAITTAATTDVVAAPGSGKERSVKTLNIRNKHASSSNTVTVLLVNPAATVELIKVTLRTGETLARSENSWLVYDAIGGVKSASTDTADPKTNDFRLTGTSATPVMTANSTTLSTIFLAQYRGNKIALFDGVNWQVIQPPTEVSLAVTGRTTDLPFDIFAFSNAGVVTLEFVNWSSATARATSLTRLDGVWTKTGDSTRRYLGSCRPRSATQFHWVTTGDDLPVKFDLWNVDNRIEFAWVLRSLTNTWAYTLATWRQCQGSVNYQVDVMVGLAEDNFVGQVVVTSRNSTISIPRHVGIGFDSTTAIHASCTTAATANTAVSIEADQNAAIAHMPAIGRHFFAWLEISTATGTCTWVGDDGALRLQSGMTGFWDA